MGNAKERVEERKAAGYIVERFELSYYFRGVTPKERNKVSAPPRPDPGRQAKTDPWSKLCAGFPGQINRWRSYEH